MIDEIVGQAKNNQNGSFKGNRFKKVVSGSVDPDTNKETNVKLPRYNPGMATGEFSFLVAPPLYQNNKIV